MGRVKLGWWIVLALAVAGFLVSGGGVRSYWSRRREYRQVRERLREARERVIKKQALLARAEKADGFLEGEARRRLSLVKSDEIEYRFVPGANKTPAVTEEKMETRPRENALREKH